MFSNLQKTFVYELTVYTFSGMHEFLENRNFPYVLVDIFTDFSVLFFIVKNWLTRRKIKDDRFTEEEKKLKSVISDLEMIGDFLFALKLLMYYFCYKLMFYVIKKFF